MDPVNLMIPFGGPKNIYQTQQSFGNSAASLGDVDVEICNSAAFASDLKSSWTESQMTDCLSALR